MHIHLPNFFMRPKHFLGLLIGVFNDHSHINHAKKASSAVSSFSFLKLEWDLEGI